MNKREQTMKHYEKDRKKQCKIMNKREKKQEEIMKKSEATMKHDETERKNNEKCWKRANRQ